MKDDVTERRGRVVKTRIREVARLDLGPKTGYPDYGSSCLFLIPLDKCQDRPRQLPSTSFPIHHSAV
jgi:hypothetical protein